MNMLPISSDALKQEGSAAGGLQTKGLHTWRVSTIGHIRAQKLAGSTQKDLWNELSKGANVGQRKILSKVLAEEFSNATVE